MEPPKPGSVAEDSVTNIFNNEPAQDWPDQEILSSYLEHIGVDENLYTQFIKQEASLEVLSENEHMRLLVDAFKASAVCKNLIGKKSFKNLSISEQSDAKRQAFYRFAHEIEREKLFYFALVKDQNTLIATAPTSNPGQKEFLGYDWSNRKGNEGIQISQYGGMLFDPDEQDNKKRIAPYIREDFTTEYSQINEDLNDILRRVETKKMLNFGASSFAKAFSLNIASISRIPSRFRLLPLGAICNIKIGGTPSRRIPEYFGGDNLWLSISEMDGDVIVDTKEKITDAGIKNSNVKLVKAGTLLLSFKLSIGKVAIAGKDLYTNEAIAALEIVSTEICMPFLRYLFLGNLVDLQTGNKAFGKSLNSKILKEEIMIPVPPLEIQNQAIEECEKVEKLYKTTRMQIEDYKKQIQEIFERLDVAKISGGGVQTK